MLFVPYLISLFQIEQTTSIKFYPFTQIKSDLELHEHSSQCELHHLGGVPIGVIFRITFFEFTTLKPSAVRVMLCKLSY